MVENGNNGVTTRVIKAAEFRGFMMKTMEVIQEDQKEIKKKVECIPLLKSDNAEIKKDVKSLHSKVGILSKKVYVISGTIALIVSIILILLKAVVKI